MGPEILIRVMWNALYIAWAISFVCLIIHFYKFFRSSATQTLATRNLTLYCFFLLLINIMIFYEHTPGPKFEKPTQTDPDHRSSDTYSMVLQYLIVASAFYKLIIALDLCWSFRNLALYLQPSTGSPNRTFLVYCLSGISIPLIYIVLRLRYLYNENDKKIECMATHYEQNCIRISRLVPIFGAFWYIKSASMNKTEFGTRFSLHIRLLVMLGGFSAVLSVTEVISQVLIPDDGSNTEYIVISVYFKIQLIGMILEGLSIAIFFTFKNDTFQSNITR